MARADAAIRVEPSARREDGAVRVTLRLEIPAGTHIEAHEPSRPFLVPTEVSFRDVEPERVSYPEPTEKDLGLPGPPLLVYEGHVTITAEAPAEEELRTVRGTIRYQPCVDGACLPPTEAEWRAPVEAGAG